MTLGRNPEGFVVMLKKLSLMLVACGLVVVLGGCPSLESRLEGVWSRTDTPLGLTVVTTVEFKDGQMIQTIDTTGGTADAPRSAHQGTVSDIVSLTATSITLRQVSAEYTSNLLGASQTPEVILAGLELLNGKEVTLSYLLVGDTLTLGLIPLARE